MSRTKRKLEKYARESLYGTRLFFPVRSGYQRLFDRHKWEFRMRALDFFSPFIHRGDLVFDVGAYVGEYSELFTELGAQVVAIEPNPHNCEALKCLARAGNVYHENCAIGDSPGKLNLHICAENPTICTVSDEWFEAAQSSTAHQKNQWLGTVEVRVTTLDQLAERYGTPDFIKIDVEGFEDHVFAGMSFQPAALSFEFNLEIPQVALRCLESSILAADYEFNFVWGLKMALANKQWVRSKELIDQLQLRSSPQGALYGDVLARRIS